MNRSTFPKEFFVSNLNSQVVAGIEGRLVFTSRDDAKGDLHNISYGQGQAFFLQVIDATHSGLASVRPHYEPSMVTL